MYIKLVLKIVKNIVTSNMECKFVAVSSLFLFFGSFLRRRNQVKILDTRTVERKKKYGGQFNYTRTREVGFSRADFARKFRKAPSASFICRYNDVERAVDRCAMYSVNENIVLPTAHTVTRAHAVSLSHTISTASRCNDAAVPAFCEGHASYIFRAGTKSSCRPSCFGNHFASALFITGYHKIYTIARCVKSKTLFQKIKLYFAAVEVEGRMPL